MSRKAKRPISGNSWNVSIGVGLTGPLPLKKLHIATRKSPCGSGTETYEKWEMRLHRRVIDINADDKAIRQLMRLKMPDDVQIELTLT